MKYKDYVILSDDGFTELLKNADDRVVLKTISNNRQHNINTAYALYPDWTDPILKRQTETTFNTCARAAGGPPLFTPGIKSLLQNQEIFLVDVQRGLLYIKLLVFWL